MAAPLDKLATVYKDLIISTIVDYILFICFIVTVYKDLIISTIVDLVQDAEHVQPSIRT